MKVTHIASRALSEATRISLMKAQIELTAAQKEAATGRHADVGASLGFRAGQTVSLRNDYARLGAILDTNAIAGARLAATQSVLEGLAGDAQSFIGTLVAARNSDNGAGIAAAEAQARLNTFVSAVNTVVDGVHILAGINSDFAPLQNYFETPTPASRQSVANAFIAEFGFSQSDPAVAGISAADMQAFLDGAFDALTEEPAWSANWSTASNQNTRSRISTGELIETSVNANEKALRKLVSAYVMIADLGAEQLNEGALQALVDTALRTAGAAIQDLTGLRANLGVAQERLSTANGRLSIQMDVLSKHVVELEAVDPYEASLRVTSLLTQIETSYALTARLQQMSLLNHL